jgi:formate hydrogenlyase subunit 6/NADH:ubiquinone oxidoreductase subunit I
MIDLFRTSLKTGSLTRGYPSEAELAPPSHRGQVLLDTSRCQGDAACARACPSLAIAVEREEAGWSWSLDDARCVFCGLCADACPSEAISLSNAFELATLDAGDLRTTVAFRGSQP